MNNYYPARIGLVALILIITVSIAVESFGITGDLDFSNRVDGYDLSQMARALNSQQGDASWNPDADLNNDGVVDNSDFDILSANMGLKGTSLVFWASDRAGNSLYLFSGRTGSGIKRISGFSSPAQVAVNTDHSVWVVDGGTRKMIWLSPAIPDEYNISISSTDHLVISGFSSIPKNFTSDPDNGDLWVVESTRIIHFTPPFIDNYNITTATGSHSIISGFQNPFDADFNTYDDSLWVSDYSSDIVYKFSSSVTTDYDVTSDTYGHISVSSVNNPGRLAVDPYDGGCWVNDIYSDEIVKISRNGSTEIARIGGFSSSIENIVVYGDTNSCWVIEGDTPKRVLVDIKSSAFELDTYNDPMGIAVDEQQGTIWLADKYRGEIHVLSPNGTILTQNDTPTEPYYISSNQWRDDQHSPQVEAEVVDNRVDIGETVIFSASATDPQGGDMEYAWDFEGDGVYDYFSTISPDTTYAYPSYGVYAPILMATDDNHLNGYDYSIVVAVGEYTAIAEANPTSGNAPLTVQFSGSYYDPFGIAEVDNYQWDFDGDGNPDYVSTNSPDTSFEYEDPGIYTAVFKIKYKNVEQVYSDTVQIDVSIQKPIAVAQSNPESGLSPLTVTLKNSQSSDPDGRLVLYKWDFENDGVFDFFNLNPIDVIHEYEEIGIYEALLEVTDDSGLSATDSIIIYATQNPPVAVAEAAPSKGNVPLTVNFEGDQSYDSDGSIVLYEWDFGEGHLLNSNGYPTSQLFLGRFSSTGCDDLESIITDIENQEPSEGDIFESKTWTSVQDNDGRFDWTDIFGYSYNSYGFSHIYVYSSAAQTVKVKYGCNNSVRFWINGSLIESTTNCEEELIIDEYFFETQLNQGWNRILAALTTGSGNWELAYRFTDISGTPIRLLYSLDKPSGSSPNGYYNSASVPNTAYIYDETGTYTATLIVTDDDGDQGLDSITIDVVLETGYPIALAQVDPATGVAPLSVNLKGDGTTDSDNNISLYEWDYQGGLLSDDMDTNSLKWIADSPWARTTIDAHSGSYCWTDSPDAYYAPNVDVSLTSLPFDLTNAVTPTLKFWERRRFGSGDRFSVEITVDRQKTWTELLYFQYTNDNWSERSVDLTEYAGESYVQIRFRLYSNDDTYQEDGWYIDDVEITHQGDDFDYQSPSNPNTTYTYNTPGYFEPLLRVTDADNHIDTDSVPLKVLSKPYADNIFPIAGNSYYKEDVLFAGSGRDPDGRIVSYEWDFDGDGTYDVITSEKSKLYQQDFTSPGSITARLRVTDNDGLTNYTDVTFNIIESDPIVTAIADPTVGNVTLTVTFNADVTDNDGTIYKYEWDFDGDDVYDYSSEGQGGAVVSYDSQYNDSSWAADNLIDGEVGGDKGWSSQSNPTYPHEIVFSLDPTQESWNVDKVVLTQHNTSNYGTKDFEIWTSDSDADSGFVLSGTFELLRIEGEQEFSFTAQSAKYIRLSILSNYGSNAIYLGDFKAFQGSRNVLTPAKPEM